MSNDPPKLARGSLIVLWVGVVAVSLALVVIEPRLLLVPAFVLVVCAAFEPWWNQDDGRATDYRAARIEGTDVAGRPASVRGKAEEGR